MSRGKLKIFSCLIVQCKCNFCFFFCGLDMDFIWLFYSSTLFIIFVNATLLFLQTRKRVLINAFTVRALRDTFPPARAAGTLTWADVLLYYW